MEVSFGANQTAAAEVAAPTGAVPVSSVPAVAASVKPPALLSEDVLPQFTDIILPRLNMVQNIGQLKDSFSPGQIVFDQRVVLYDPPRFNAQTNSQTSPGTPPLNLILLGWKPNPTNPNSYTRYAEKVVGGFGGMIVNSEEEVRANGGTLDWAEWDLKKASGMKRFEPVVDGLFLIQRPACATPKDPNADPVFVYEADGKRYALAFWALRSTLYTEAYKRVFGPARLTGFLKHPNKWYSWSFSVSTREKPFKGGNKSWIPIVAPNQQLSPALFDFAKSVLSPSQASASEAA